jgi:hypothetical protein
LKQIRWYLAFVGLYIIREKSDIENLHL